jgi:hypothetical protein
MVRALACLLLVLGLVGCGGGGSPDGPARPDATGAGIDEELRAELLDMAEQDQAERTGGGTLDDEPRTERLKEIVAEHGWPTYDLVGRDGEDAAWVIAQHSDLDPEFQAEALELLRAAVAEGQASPGNLAYLEDRVRAGRGEPQLYGTQVGCRRGGPDPGPIEDPAGLDERRRAAGLPPFERYLRTMTRICRQ